MIDVSAGLVARIENPDGGLATGSDTYLTLGVDGSSAPPIRIPVGNDGRVQWSPAGDAFPLSELTVNLPTPDRTN